MALSHQVFIATGLIACGALVLILIGAAIVRLRAPAEESDLESGKLPPATSDSATSDIQTQIVVVPAGGQ